MRIEQPTKIQQRETQRPTSSGIDRELRAYRSVPRAAVNGERGTVDLATRIRTILAEHGLVAVDDLAETVRRIMLAINEDKQHGGW